MISSCWASSVKLAINLTETISSWFLPSDERWVVIVSRYTDWPIRIEYWCHVVQMDQSESRISHSILMTSQIPRRRLSTSLMGQKRFASAHRPFAIYSTVVPKYFILTCLLFPFISFIILLAVCQYYKKFCFPVEETAMNWMEDCCRRGSWNCEGKMRLYFYTWELGLWG